MLTLIQKHKYKLVITDLTTVYYTNSLKLFKSINIYHYPCISISLPVI